MIGMSADGVPIYGYYQASGVLAQSCWTARDYADSSDDYGCGGSGSRSCLMVNQWDKTQGTDSASSNGPSVTDTVTSLSGNDYTASTGAYSEDYYYDSDCTDQGTQYLDAFNGHSHGSYGYHIHATSSFPYLIGPAFYGELPETTFTSCLKYVYANGTDVSSSDGSGSGSDSNQTAIIVGVVVGVGVLGAAATVCFIRRRRRSKQGESDTNPRGCL